MNIIILVGIIVLITASSGCSWTEDENEMDYKKLNLTPSSNDATDSYPESGNDASYVEENEPYVEENEPYVEDNSGSSSSYAGEGNSHPESPFNSDPED